MTKSRQEKVREFMLLMYQECPSKPTIPSEKIRILRAKLMLEEVLETIEAMGVTVLISIGNRPSNAEYVEILSNTPFEFDSEGIPNLDLIADGLADLDYVGPAGTAVAFGIDLEPIFDEVHRSNMSKLWTAKEVGEISPQTYIFYNLNNNQERCFIVRNSAGKVIKSPSYEPAKITELICKQLEE